ncbi:zinc transporter ZIP11-like [Physella acuta]|uniref:zinc transporter ZIP11-like n=1 Tax=Physella acuta TaxID=109671 RepID=UPI0027DD2A9E|nr:zinc transporter ZIP11-like [Physella acuta]XP_059156779.1 zinc transporter ZIP11-like [Physella acuta]XP_059156780.1 zinc transporter ZIP11-like [Physella acuta]
MLENSHPLLQTLLGTLFTWGLTAAGAALVFVFSSAKRKLLDGSLGFAAGVMVAASYWSLLAPAIDMAENSGLYGSNGQWAFLPIAVGFVLGALFVYAADFFIPNCGELIRPDGSSILDDIPLDDSYKSEDSFHSVTLTVDDNYSNIHAKHRNPSDIAIKRRQNVAPISDASQRTQQAHNSQSAPGRLETSVGKAINWRRMMLLIIAITIHNIPEGLAVGVGFGAIGKSSLATFEKARNLAFGIGIQNFPEGLAVSLPLRSSGMSVMKSFWYGQLSGMVEPIAGLLGAFAVTFAEPLLPYALAFASGAMIFVVVDDIIPEAQTAGNGKLASWGAIVGFVVMMSLDVGLG